MPSCSALCVQTSASAVVECEICDVTVEQSAIKAHYKTVHAAQRKSRPEHPNAQFACELCRRKFTDKSKVKRHLSDVHRVGDVKTYHCDVCTKVFNRMHNLQRHMLTMHGSRDDITKLQCAICSHFFQQQHQLQRHLLLDHGIDDLQNP